VKSHFIQSAWNNNAWLSGFHRLASAAEHLQFFDSLVADNKYLFHIPKCVEGDVHCPNPTQRESKAAHEWPSSTLLPGQSNPVVDFDTILSLGV
jgi:hypothetical protein